MYPILFFNIHASPGAPPSPMQGPRGYQQPLCHSASCSENLPLPEPLLSATVAAGLGGGQSIEGGQLCVTSPSG